MCIENYYAIKNNSIVSKGMKLVKVSDNIELYCGHCKNKTSIDLKALERNTEITCSGCKSTIYWHVCPDCETGYYNMEETGCCPECSDVLSNKKSRKSKINILDNKECPWCSKPVNVLKVILLKKNLGQCKWCNKYFDIKGFGFSLLLSNLFLLISGIIGKKIIAGSENNILRIIIVSTVLFGSIYIFIKNLKLVKYN